MHKARVGAKRPPELVAYTGLIRPVRWPPRSDWIAFDDNAGLRIVSPDARQDRVISPRHWQTYGGSNDGASLYGIVYGDNRRLNLVPAEQETTRGDLGLSMRQPSWPTWWDVPVSRFQDESRR